MLWTGLLLALTVPLTACLWGFSVDDAWIVSRVVENGLRSGTYTFNASEPRTDAITPLGYAELVGALCRLSGSFEPFAVARVLGLVATLASALVAAWSALGPRHSEGVTPTWHRLLPWTLALAACPTLAAWAGAGLETPAVGLLCTLGCALSESWADRRSSASAGAVGAVCFGAAVGLRPELVGFGALAVIQLGRTRGRVGPSEWLCLVAFLLPACAPAVVRLVAFGTPLPLSFLAKEPEATSGLRYLLGGLAFCGPVWLIWSLPFAQQSRERRWALVAGAHVLSVGLAGGDWMPLYRLWAPVLPWLGAVCVRSWRPSWASWALLVLACSANALLLGAHGVKAGRVLASRDAMVQELTPLLHEAHVVAAVDIGWVGRATSARVVDLAGVTDPRVARLPGGHTSKLIHPGFFAARSVDAWIIRARDRAYVPGAPLETVHASYAVDARLLARAADLSFRGVAVVPLPHTGEQYVVARYVAPSSTRVTP